MTDAVEAPYVIEYRADDGVRASMCVFRAAQPDAAVVVCLPAMGVRASYYKEFALALSRTGLHVVTSDLRGIGSSSVRASKDCDFGYADILERDLPALLTAVDACFPSHARWLLGHSLGGQLSALHLSANGEAARGLILIAACNVHYKGWSWLRRWRVLGTTVLFRLLGTALGYVPAGRFGFAGNEARGVVVDWSNNCWTGRYVVRHGAHDYEQSLARMTKPVLALSFARDTLAPRKSVENLLAKFRQSKVTARHFSHDHPGLENIGHFEWVRRPQVVVETIREWVNAA